jgi:ADP-heptose:LPS heptosyltransferase
MPTALIHLAAGIGDIVLATPLVVAVHELGYQVHLLLDSDYPATAELFEGWHLITDIHSRAAVQHRLASFDRLVPAVPPFYWAKFAHLYRRAGNAVARPPDSLFYQHIQRYYLHFAQALGFPCDRNPPSTLPVGPSEAYGVTAATVVLAPGCKTGDMAAKRWPYFRELSSRLKDVALVGTADDMPPGSIPPHVRCFVDQLGLRQTAEVLASAGLVVANDSGLAHLAGAVGTPSLILFGPTAHDVLEPLAAGTKVLRSGLPCEPCWHAERFHACSGRIDCLRNLTVDRVEREIRSMLETTPDPAVSWGD